MKHTRVFVGLMMAAGMVVAPMSASAGWFGRGERTIELGHGGGTLEVQVRPDQGRALVLEAGGPNRWTFDGSTDALVGGSYSIVLHNVGSERIKIVVGVDGLNVYGKRRIVGRADSDTGSILGPGETRVLQGWQMNNRAADRFVFSPENWSEGRGRTDSQIGAIVVQVYRERPRDFFGLEDQDCESRRNETVGQRRKAAPRAAIGTTSGDRVPSHVRSVSFESLSVYPAAWAEINYGRQPQPEPKRGRLGIWVSGCGRGSRIDRVMPGSVADEAGLQAGDVITRIDTADQPSSGTVQDIVRSKSPGDWVFLEIERGRHQLSLKIQL